MALRLNELCPLGEGKTTGQLYTSSGENKKFHGSSYNGISTHNLLEYTD